MAFLDETGLERLWTHLISRLNYFASITELTNHTGNTNIHITAAERTAWNLAKEHADTEQVYSVNGQTGAVIVSAVPSCTADDDGKFLRVYSGTATWQEVPNAEEADF